MEETTPNEDTSHNEESTRDEGPARNASNWANKAFEALTLYADANLQLSQQLTEFAVNAAKEGTTLYANLQTANMEAIQEGQAYLMKRLSELPEDAQNPSDAYQKTITELGAGTEKVGKLVQDNTQVVMRSSEQYRQAAQQTGTDIRETYTQFYEKLTALIKPRAQ